MKSIGFPKMFRTSSTNIVSDKDATSQNLRLLLSSEKGEMASDPAFGVSIRKYYFDQNGFILSDILKDEIYTQVRLFIPQMSFTRDDIRLFENKGKVYASITGTNMLDFTTNTLELAVFREDER